ncbi:PQQ-binding-like beta-propeller repeat protein [Lutibacter sp.]|uniref:outer membrane protein assembly factor BamB family protein n=1 Tax=Lutibacter sp. TaxID=1925666 RepID=UPI003565DCC9
MKTKILVLVLLFLAIPVWSQASKIQVDFSNEQIGENFLNGKKIMASAYVFPKRIHEIYVDTFPGYVSLQLRKLSKNGKILNVKGEFVVFDFENRIVKWSQKIDYSRGNINQYNRLIMEDKGNNLISLSIENGEELWTVKNDFYYVNTAKDIAIGYKNKGLAGNIHTLEAIDLKTGNALWERELKRDYGWNSKIRLNDSTLLIVAGGLHSVNLFNGNGWDYETVTGKKDYTETIAKNAAGIALGILTGTYVTSSGPSVVREVVSNVIIDSANLYVASKEKIAQINKNDGHVNWSTNLPEDLMSKSSIFLKDSLLYVVNYGYAYWGNKKIDFGQPFIQCLNANTGKQLFLKTIADKENPILDFRKKEDALMAIFKDKLVCFSLIDGSEIQSKLIDVVELGELKYFTTNTIFVKENETVFKNLVSNDNTTYYIQSSKEKTLVFGSDLTNKMYYELKDLYFKYGSYKNYTFIGNEEETILLNNENRKVGRLDISVNSLIYNGKLFNFNDEKLLVVDMATIF